MPYSVDKKHTVSEFYYPGETNYPDATFKGKDKAEQNQPRKSVSGLLYKSELIAIQQSHIKTPLLNLFVRSVRESIAFGFYCTDLHPSSLGLYKKPQAILSHIDLALS